MLLSADFVGARWPEGKRREWLDPAAASGLPSGRSAGLRSTRSKLISVSDARIPGGVIKIQVRVPIILACGISISCSGSPSLLWSIRDIAHELSNIASSAARGKSSGVAGLSESAIKSTRLGPRVVGTLKWLVLYRRDDIVPSDQVLRSLY